MKKPNITTPAKQSEFLKVLVHGPSGAGKTRFAASFPKPLIFDIEGGTMSVPESEFPDARIIPASDLGSVEVLKDYLQWTATKEADQFQTVVLDSLTHQQQLFLGKELPDAKNPMQVYGAWQQHLREIMTLLHSLKKHTVVVTRSKSGEDIEGAERLLPELSPAAFSVVPALVDFGLVISKKTTGLGAAATTKSVLFTEHPKYWGKTRRTLPKELAPTYQALAEAMNGKV